MGVLAERGIIGCHMCGASMKIDLVALTYLYNVCNPCLRKLMARPPEPPKRPA